MDWGVFFSAMAGGVVAILGAWGTLKAVLHKQKMDERERNSKIRKEDAETDRGLAGEYRDLLERYEQRETNWEKICDGQRGIINEYQGVERECHAHNREISVWVDWAVPRMEWLRTIAEKGGYEVGPDLSPPKEPAPHDPNIQYRLRNVTQAVKLMKASTPVIQPTQVPTPTPDLSSIHPKPPSSSEPGGGI